MRVARVLAMMSCVAGCDGGSTPVGPPPAAGYNETEPDYQPAPLVNPTVVSTSIDLPTAGAEVLPLDLPARLKPRQELAFDLSIDMGDAPAGGYILKVDFWVPGENDARTLTEGGITSADYYPDQSDRKLNLRVEMRAPLAPRGRHNVDVSIVDFARSEQPMLVAQGEVIID